MPDERTERGFGIFGRVTSANGSTWRVQESSRAGEGAHCWIFADDEGCLDFVPYSEPEARAWRPHVPTPPVTEHMHPDLHLSVPEAEKLIAILQAFVDEARADKLTEPAEVDHAD